jgi:peptidoglycan hydrolase CwlO-like protein
MTSNDASNILIRYWQIIVVMMTMMIGGFTIKYDVAALQMAMADEQKEVKEQDVKLTEVEKAIVKIETTQAAMQEDVGEIKEEQQSQSDKLDKIIEKLSER